MTIRPRGVYVGRLGQQVLLRFVQRGLQYDLTFDLDEAELLITKILDQIRDIRPPPTSPSLLNGGKSTPRLKLVK